MSTKGTEACAEIAWRRGHAAGRLASPHARGAHRRVEVAPLPSITARGRKQLESEKKTFEFLLAAIARVMEA